ncbi:hypothetical protein SARC_07803 [Sphaeroforma arctica JP610]|uniref:DEAD-box helicase OB fold domain-containing protein n=1 Tax=Sphaeroforma arctica JP610 TaxID=667725 RepID=A0A0L0FV59_9EUKA|nr:hypothetical protein SARC_07803 [Sphaeroforma arctica JP610]KNC79823.1 hypothetical protein SARC_07803 [Sphaeroforma arctica JP610]|eukprot:XP_014153725.1 hypothetical protein SARC_07803 [Sphaeroforma arctica JP610]
MQAQSRRSRKILRLTEARDETGEDAESESVDLHDLDFRLSKGTDGSLASGRVLTAGDTALLSLLVASGLYPNCAIADANNHVRKQSEYVFHTKAKPIVALHPSSVYYSNTEFLTATTVNGAGSINNTGVDSSASNQKRNAPDLFCYGSLIETSKPYLCNVMKIPALPTLLLVAKSVDTNVACDQLLIDDWLLITLGSNKNAVDLLCVALELRKCWAQLVAKRLSHIFATANDSEPGMSESMDKPSSNTREHEFADRSSLALKLRAIGAPGRLAAYLEEEGSIGVSKNSTAESVGEGLVKFMQTKVRYSLVRAKQSELPGLMVWNELAGDANDGNGGNKTDVGVSKKVETASADIESEVMSNTVTVEPGSLEESVSGSTNTGAAETGVSAVVGIVPCVDKTKGGVAISENIRIGSFSGASGDIGY